MVQFKLSERKRDNESASLEDRVFVPCLVHSRELIAISSGLLSGEEPDDQGCLLFFGREAAEALLEEHRTVYGDTPGWTHKVVTLAQYLERTFDSGPVGAGLAKSRLQRRRLRVASN